MSHEIERNEDYVYALQDGLLWHGLGMQRNRRLTIDEVIREIPRLNETPVLKPLRYEHTIPTTGLVIDLDCGNRRAIVFPSDGAFIGMATTQYQPKAYAEAFRQAFGWIESLGAWVSGAALLRGGSRAFIMARVPSLDFTVAEDKHVMWLSVFAGSDGVTGVYPHATFVREVCANTVGMGLAEARANGRCRSIAHHGNMNDKLAEASIALAQLAEVRDAFSAACEKLLDKAISRTEEREAIEALVPGDSSRAENSRHAILRLAHSGKGNARYQGTAYATFQGVTDFVDHVAVQSSARDVNERRFLYSVEGAGSSLKAKALDLLAA